MSSDFPSCKLEISQTFSGKNSNPSNMFRITCVRQVILQCLHSKIGTNSNMKQLSQLLTALVFCSLMIFISCGKKDKNDPIDPVDEVGEKLVSTWEMSSVTVDGTARDEWADFTLTIAYNPADNTGTYTTSGVPTNAGADVVWPSSGTFSLAVGSTTSATRNDGVVITVTVSDTGLDLRFPISGSGDRVSTFDGAWQFVFTK